MSTRFRVVLALLFLMAAASFIGAYKFYNAFYNVIPESKDISNINVRELTATGPTKLKISGLPVYSGMVLREITAKKEGPSITVTLHMAMVGLSQPLTPVGLAFEYELAVPDDVNEVRIGRDGKLIWARAQKRPPHTKI